MLGSGFEAAVAGLPTADAPELAMDRMGQLVRLRSMVDAALTGQVAAFDARAGARYDGQTSTVAWLRSRLRLGGQAGQLVQVARHLSGLPLVAKAFAAGEITFEQVAVLARLVGQVGPGALVGYESILLDLARQVTPARLRQACDHLRELLDAEGEQPRAARQWRQRYFSAARTMDGMVHLQGLLDAPSGDVVLTALQAAMPVPVDYEERTPPQRRADALVDICAGWLSAGEAPSCGGIRPQAQVTVSLRSLQSTQPPGGGDDAALPADVASAASCSGALVNHADGTSGDIRSDAFGEVLGDVPVLACGQPVAASRARKLSCDAAVIPVVLSGDSEPLDIGRLSRVVPVGMRRALNLRDGGCRFAGCDRPASWCDAHHLRHWADGGPTALDNLILLCGYHHTLLHEGWRLHGDPQQTIWFRRPDGTRLELTSAPRGRPAIRAP